MHKCNPSLNRIITLPLVLKSTHSSAHENYLYKTLSVIRRNQQRLNIFQKQKMVNWKRAENVPYPSVWRTFERKGLNGEIRKYWIQDLTPEYEDIFLKNMVTVFLNDEPLCKHSNFSSDLQAVEEFTDLWKEGFQHKLALICLTKDEDGKVIFVGGNMTCLCEKGEKSDMKNKSKSLQRVLEVVIYVAKGKNAFKKLQCDEYLTAYGLYVMPEFRGQGLGTEILKARRELCLTVGLKGSGTAFTSIVSQKNAKHAGFEDFYEIDYDELEKINPDWSFPGITRLTKSPKYMVIKYT